MLLLLALLASLASAAKIDSLPGYNGPALSMYSGYVPVGGSRELFYWFIEAEKDVANAPLVFWYQGGPGCSGLAGLLTENGPLRANPDGSVSYTDLSWTQFASVVWLEQPAFVGYSYSDDPLDHECTDAKAAKDNLAFVEGWLEQFPQYKGRPTWFAGESYGGVYVPTLTALALGDPTSTIFKQLVGVATGNPVFNCGSGTSANQMNLYYWHGLVSYSDFSRFNDAGCQAAGSATCDSIFSEAQNKIGVIDQELKRAVQEPSLDPDNLYQDFCTGNASLSVVNVIPANCAASGDVLTAYLRRDDVHKALHTSGPLGLYTEKWAICSDKVLYTSSGQPMAPLYRSFSQSKPGFKILVYSGDVDIATVPFSTTNPCTAEISSNVTVPWQPWFVNGQTAGYVETTDLYTRATVKGAGHETPQYQPLSSMHMFHRFITSGNLTDPDQIPRPSVAARFRKTQGEQLRFMMQKNKHINW